MAFSNLIFNGLDELSKYIMDTLARHPSTQYLDVDHKQGQHPASAKFIYTLNFTKWKLRGDTTKEAMMEFQKLYTAGKNIAGFHSLLCDTILKIDPPKGKNRCLRLASRISNAEGFYCYE